jgi:ribonuclease P protein component
MRVRRLGKSYAHPLVVLVVLPDADGIIHVGFTAGRSVGKAVQRNRAKRMLREAIRSLLPMIKPGWKIILISRSPVLNAKLPELETAIFQLLQKAGLIYENHGI